LFVFVGLSLFVCFCLLDLTVLAVPQR
jgi:hypothetical protein